MTMQTDDPTRQLEDLLFKGWRKDLPRFVPDGIIDPDTYDKAKIRITFLLKDPNDPPREDWTPWDLREVLYNEKFEQHQTMWTVAARWIYDLLYEKVTWNEGNRNKPFLKNFDKIGHFQAMMLRNVAVVNIKKEGGGGQTDVTELRRHAEKHHQAICNQTIMHGTDLIIAGGIPIWMLRLIYEGVEKAENNTSNGLIHWYLPELKSHLIKYHHPACRKSHKELHLTLVEAVREVIAL
jgi:hypothetical protein